MHKLQINQTVLNRARVFLRLKLILYRNKLDSVTSIIVYKEFMPVDDFML
jgi:hypothetical protein